MVCYQSRDFQGCLELNASGDFRTHADYAQQLFNIKVKELGVYTPAPVSRGLLLGER